MLRINNDASNLLNWHDGANQTRYIGVYLTYYISKYISIITVNRHLKVLINIDVDESMSHEYLISILMSSSRIFKSNLSVVQIPDFEVP